MADDVDHTPRRAKGLQALKFNADLLKQLNQHVPVEEIENWIESREVRQHLFKWFQGCYKTKHPDTHQSWYDGLLLSGEGEPSRIAIQIKDSFKDLQTGENTALKDEELFKSKDVSARGYTEQWAYAAYHIVQADLANICSIFKSLRNIHKGWSYQTALLLLVSVHIDLNVHSTEGYFAKMFQEMAADPATQLDEQMKVS